MLKIQEFINCFDTIEEANMYLKRNLNIETVATTVYEKGNTCHTILYKPAQNANMNDALVREAHCLTLDNDADVMSKAWDYPVIAENAKDFSKNFKFSNEDTVEEIPDGGIVVIYNIEGRWHVGSPNDVYGEDYLPGLSLPGFTYARQIKGYLEHMHGEWYKPFENVNPMLCFVFSFVSKDAANVMPAVRSQLYLMAVINLDNYTEISAGMVQSLAKGMGIPTPISYGIYGIRSLTQRLRGMRTLAPGLMVRGKKGDRVMIPNPIYTLMKNALDAGDRVRPVHIAKLLTLLRDKADLSVLVSSYPDIKAMINLLWDTRVELWQELLELWKLAKPVSDNMHDFAVMVQHHPLNYILFKVKDKGVNIPDEIENLKPDRLVKLVQEKHGKEFDNAARLLKFLGGSKNVKEESSIPFYQEGD